MLLTAYGYLPIWKKYDVLAKARESRYHGKVFENLYSDIREYRLTQDFLWNDFLPPGSPLENWDEWVEGAERFLLDKDKYIADEVFIKYPRGWERANDGVSELFSKRMKEFVTDFKLCNLYDGIWPRVGLNYRTIELDAFLNPFMKIRVLENRDRYSIPPPLSWMYE